MRWKAVALAVALLVAPIGGAVPEASAHPTDRPHQFVWEGHWTATWDANGAWRITERGDFTVVVAFGGAEAIAHSGGTATLRVIEFHNMQDCHLQLPPLPSRAITVDVGAAVRWARPSAPAAPAPGIGEMHFFINDFTPIILQADNSDCAGPYGPRHIPLPSLGTHGALCRTLNPDWPGTSPCLGFGLLPPISVHGLIARGSFLTEDRQPGAHGDIVSLFHLEIEAVGRCPQPGREAWVLERSGLDLNSATVNRRPAFNLGDPVPVDSTMLATDNTGTLVVQFADLSEVRLAPSSRLRLRASCGAITGMQIHLLAERGRIEIEYAGHLGGGIGYIVDPAASPPPLVVMTFHP